MIRRMQPAEINGVVSLFSQAAEAAHWSAQDLTQLEASGACVWVDLEDGHLAGAVALRVMAGEAEILNLAVGAQWRQRGIGRGLMAAALEEAKAREARRAFLEVRESNSGARAFYARLGFSQDGRRRYYYQNPPEDALLFSRGV